MGTFFNILRLGVFPLALAALYGFGEYRKTLDDGDFDSLPESERSRIWSKGVCSGVFRGLLAAPLICVLNGMFQEAFLVGLIKKTFPAFADLYRAFATTLTFESVVTLAFCCVFAACFSWFPVWVTFRKCLLTPEEFEADRRFYHMPKLSPKATERVRVASAYIAAFLTFCVAFPAFFFVGSLIAVGLATLARL